MIRRSGPRSWENVHRTVKTRLADLIDVCNPGPTETAQGNFGILRQAAANFEAIIQDAQKRQAGGLGMGSKQCCDHGRMARQHKIAKRLF